MALFRVGAFSHPDLPLRGEGVYLRLSQMSDHQEWVELRERSRAFLTPWEPLWPLDDFTRSSFRYRVRRHAEEMYRDEAFSFFIFREGDNVSAGRIDAGSYSPRRLAGGDARLLDGPATRGQRLHVARRSCGDHLRVREPKTASDRSGLSSKQYLVTASARAHRFQA